MKKLALLVCMFISVTAMSQDISFGKVSEAELKATQHALDSTADAAYLFKKRRTYFDFNTNDGFNVVTEYHSRIKIYTKEGFDYATRHISYRDPKKGDREKVTDLKAYTFNLVDGEIKRTKVSRKDIFEERISKYASQKKITFPEIKEGSVIDIKYKIISPRWIIETLNFQYGIPVDQLDYKVTIPEYFLFNQRAKGYYTINPVKSISRGTISWNTKTRNHAAATVVTQFSRESVSFNKNILEYKQTNIPALKDNEPFVGNINNYRGGMQFELAGTRFPNSRFRDFAVTWGDICKRIYKSEDFGGQLEKTRYFKKDLAQILAEAKTDSEKIASIYYFVQSKMTWNEYFGKFTDEGVKRAYADGKGNVAEINLILTAMLRSAGLNANPVLVSTRANGVPLFPTYKGFNYVVTKVNLGNSYVLLDASDKFSTPNILPARALNWNGREITPNGTSNWVAMVPRRPSKETYTLQLKIADDYSVQGMMRKSLSNHYAMYYRNVNHNKKEEDIIGKIEEKYGIEIEDFKLTNLKKLGKNITYTIKFDIDEAVEVINDKAYINPMVFLARKENVFKAKERSYPIDFVMPWEDKFTVSISIPEGYTVAELPKPLAIGLPEKMGLFKYQVTQQGNKIKLIAMHKNNKSIIGPEYYETLKEFYKQIVAKQQEKIVLVKAAAAK